MPIFPKSIESFPPLLELRQYLAYAGTMLLVNMRVSGWTIGNNGHLLIEDNQQEPVVFPLTGVYRQVFSHIREEG
jgi:hypothetical protein